MKADEALMAVRENTGLATELCLRMEHGERVHRADSKLLVRCLQTAMAAALELDARVAGVEESKRGD